jgi:hypothetical protein
MTNDYRLCSLFLLVLWAILFCWQPKEKALPFSRQGFFFVAEAVEISNLLKDISEIINLRDFLR